MKITYEELRTVASVAKLAITDAEAQKYVEDINGILDYANKIKDIDVANVEPFISPLYDKTPLRADVVEQSLTQAEALKNASLVESGYYKVPKTIGE